MKIYGTAEGAALSTKDFGVAFSSSTPASTTQYEQDACGSTGTGGLKPINLGDGIQVTNSSFVLYDKKVITVEWLMYKVGSPTGTLRTYVCQADGTIIDSSDTVDVATLGTSTSGTYIEFTGLTTTISSGDCIMVSQASGSIDDSNHAKVLFSNTTCVDNTHYASREAGGTVCVFDGSGGASCPWGNEWDAIGKFTYED